MLAAGDRKLSEVRGTSEWVPKHVQVAWLGLLADEGYEIHQQVPETRDELEDLAQLRRPLGVDEVVV